MPQDEQEAEPVELQDDELRGVDGGTLNGRVEEPSDPKDSDRGEQLEL